jgi:type IV secretory pathway TraG/TraD family ATPase VirD4
LFTGLATQIVYGGCDHDTADFYSKASGTTTADANPDPQKANFRQRPLLTVDEVVTPQIGNCTIFARYVEPAFATQVILTARLTRLYEREDWQARFSASKTEEPLLLERGVSVTVLPTFTPVVSTNCTGGRFSSADACIAELHIRLKSATNTHWIVRRSLIGEEVSL